jgi:hypothetical protein
MGQARTEVAEKWLAHYGPVERVSDLTVTHNTTGLRTCVFQIACARPAPRRTRRTPPHGVRGSAAHRLSRGVCRWLACDEYLLIDGESHREDDSSDAQRWLKGDEYDIAVGRIRRSTGSLLEVLVHCRKPTGVLDDDDDAEILTAINSRPDLPLCAWGYGPEWWWVDQAGRRKKNAEGKRVDDGSDGIDLKTAIVTVAPKMRKAASAVGKARGSMSQNLVVPVMGLRRTAYHEALPDVLTEGIGASAFSRVLERPHAQGGCMP